MGMFDINEEGRKGDDAPRLRWSDTLTEIMAGALADIRDDFMTHFQREPTRAELQAGLLYSLEGLNDVRYRDYKDARAYREAVEAEQEENE